MKTISVRDIRGSDLREAAAKGELVGIQNNRALIGIIIPMSAQWTRHVVESNWSRLRQTLSDSEEAVKNGELRTPPSRQESRISSDTSTEKQPAQESSGLHRSPLEVVSAVAEKAMEALSDALPAAEAAAARALHRNKLAIGTTRSARPVRIGDISGKLIEDAGEAGQPLVITHDRELIGILVPVTARLVQSLIEKNLSRVLHTIELGEKSLETSDPESWTTSQKLRERWPDLRD